jgi:hypothetical protein
VAHIKTISEDQARGARRAFLWYAKRQYGYLPGIFQILAPDLRLASHAGGIYNHLHLRKRSPLTRLQGEMLATVVNGHLSGAP